MIFLVFFLFVFSKFMLCVFVLVNWCLGRWQWKKEMESLQDVPPGYDPVMDEKPKSKAAKRNERKKEKRQQVNTWFLLLLFIILIVSIVLVRRGQFIWPEHFVRKILLHLCIHCSYVAIRDLGLTH